MADFFFQKRNFPIFCPKIMLGAQSEITVGISKRDHDIVGISKRIRQHLKTITSYLPERKVNERKVNERNVNERKVNERKVNIKGRAR